MLFSFLKTTYNWEFSACVCRQDDSFAKEFLLFLVDNSHLFCTNSGVKAKLL